MTVSVHIVKAALRSVWAACLLTNPRGKLRDQLIAKSALAVGLVLPAGSLAANTANGHMSEFAKYGAGQITMAQVVEVWGWLIDCYDDVSANAGLAVDGSKDDVIEPLIEAQLRPMTGYVSNWQFLSK